jgi:predicted TIM-barrel fold metal-dependent hydrolase
MLTRRVRRCSIFAFGLALTGSMASAVPPAAPLDFVPWRADFHMHIRSQTAYDTEAVMCATFGPGACHLNTEHQARSGADAIAAFEEVGAKKGVVLSMAYMFGAPSVAAQHYDVARMTRAENEYVAEQVAAHPDKLVGFFGVDPLSSSALDEVRYWARDGRLKGLKLHFANSEVNLRDPAQVKQIAAVVVLAGKNRLPINFHLSTGEKFGAEDTEIFIRDILAPAGDPWVQLSHAGGFGGSDDLMFNVLRVFAAHIAHHDPATRHVVFDLASVVSAKTTAQQAADLVELMRKIGLSRFVVGSDYDGGTPKATDEFDREKLPLSQEEWRTVVQSCVPWVCGT